MTSSSYMDGFVYFPKGTLKPPFAFTRYNPLKQVLLRKKNSVVLRTQSCVFRFFAPDREISPTNCQGSGIEEIKDSNEII